MENKKIKLWIFTELFYPEETSTSYILTKIANRLSQKYNVEVVCGEPVYGKNEKTTYFSVDSSIKISRVKSFKGNKDNTLSRIFRFLTLSISFFLKLIFSVKKNDKVFIVTNPAPFLVLVSLIKRFKKIETTILVHDVFPENTISGGFISSKDSFFYKILIKIFDVSYSNYNNIIVLGRDMKSLFENKLKNFSPLPRIEVIENWADIETILPLDNSPQDKIIFQFAGNLGAIQGLDNLLAVISEVRNENLLFEFVGSGKMKSKMQRLVEDKKLTNIIFKPPFAREKQNKILNSCDVGIVTLANGMLGLGVPSKSYNILAAGKPILYIGDKNSEIFIMVNEYKLGFCFENNDKEKLINFFNSLDLIEFKNRLKIFTARNREVVVNVFSENKILEKYTGII